MKSAEEQISLKNHVLQHTLEGFNSFEFANKGF